MNPLDDGFHLSFRRMVMSPHCNATDNLFGGEMLAWIDEGAAMYAACQMGTDRLVTVHMDGVDFKKPIPKGWVCTVYCRSAKEGNTSLVVEVLVTRKSYTNGEESEITRTQLVFVNVDEQGRKAPWVKRAR